MDRFLISFKYMKEEEIQVVIGEIFHDIGYKIDYLHFSDRSNEDGADLIVSNDKEKISIAVKIKPDKNDIPQLLELNDRKTEDKRIYVYLSTPTKKFLDFMEKCKNVEFWDFKKVNNFIKTNNLYFFANLLFNEHNTIRHLELIKYLFFRIHGRCKGKKKKKIKEMNKASISHLWRLKDFSVIINKIPLHTRYFFEEPLKIKNDELNLHFLGLFLDFLDSLEKPTSNFSTWFLHFYSKNQNLVDSSIIEMWDRSHWYSLGVFDPNINMEDFVKQMKESLDSDEELEDLIKKVSRKEDKKILENIREMKKSNDVWQAIDRQIKQLSVMGYFLEEAVDDILSEYLKDYTIRYNEDRDFIR